MKKGDLVSWRKEIWKQDSTTKKRLGRMPCKIFEDIGIVLAQRTPDSYDVMFSSGEITKGVWRREMEVLSESR